MITNPNEYYNLLYQIQNQNFPFTIVGENQDVYHYISLPIPTEETIYNIDLNNRIIQTPKFLSVQHDHSSEYIWFKCARYFDHVDLTRTCCIIQYKKPNGDSKIYSVPFYDTITLFESDEIVFPWVISKDATEFNGILEFAIRFYTVAQDSNDETKLLLTYSLNTQPARGTILEGFDLMPEYEQNNFEASVLEQLYAKIATLTGEYALYWLEAK